MTKKTIAYKDAGVDIQAGNTLVNKIKPLVKSTSRPEVVGGLGGFAGLFALPLDRYRQPLLVAATDGVGTKLKIAGKIGKHDTIGIDLVAMCVNDLIVQGAEPLFFLDYFATSHLDVETAEQVIKGIANGCKQAGTALIGGETAEMPGIYHGEDYDLAGFCTGIVEKDELIDGSKVANGDILIGVASSGPHSNGYSLIRKLIDEHNINLDTTFESSTLGNALLTPTRIYVKPLLSLIKTLPVHAAAHITGGGLLENVPRVLPKGTKALINASSWQQPAIFNWLQELSNLDQQQMWTTFNCGVGMTVCVSADNAEKAINTLTELGETAWRIGEIASSDTSEPCVEII